MLDLEQLKDGDIVICYIYSKINNDCYGSLEGVFNEENTTLTQTNSNSKFDFNNHDYHEVNFKFNMIGSINNYKYNDKEVRFNDIFNYLTIDKGLDDLSYQVHDNLNADIGYFEEFPINVVEVKEGVISRIVFGRGIGKDGYNQDLLNWLYYLKDMKVEVKI